MCTPHSSLISTKCKSNIFPKDGDLFCFVITIKFYCTKRTITKMRNGHKEWLLLHSRIPTPTQIKSNITRTIDEHKNDGDICCNQKGIISKITHQLRELFFPENSQFRVKRLQHSYKFPFSFCSNLTVYNFKLQGRI